MDIGNTVSKVRKEYKEYLREKHPDWAESTVRTHVLDAFYLYQNTIALSGSALRMTIIVSSHQHSSDKVIRALAGWGEFHREERYGELLYIFRQDSEVELKE